MAKVGRPKLSSATGERFTIRLSGEEAARVTRYAASVRGVSVHGWLRARILETGRIAHLTVRLARLQRALARARETLAARDRETLEPVSRALAELYAEVAGE